MWSSVECVRCRVFAALTMPGNYMFGLWPLPCPATICLVCGPYHARQLYVTVWWSYLYVGYMFALQYAYYNICMYNYVCIYIYISLFIIVGWERGFMLWEHVFLYVYTLRHVCIYNIYIFIFIYIYTSCSIHILQHVCTMWAPSVISWFVNPSNYSYKYHKP